MNSLDSDLGAASSVVVGSGSVVSVVSVAFSVSVSFVFRSTSFRLIVFLFVK